MKAIEENKLHELAILFMDQFTIGRDMSLDEFLSEHGDELTDDERNLGHHILSLFNI